MVSVLFSSDLERSFLFYDYVLRFRVEKHSDGLLVRHGDLELKLLPSDDPELICDLAVLVHVDNAPDLYRALSHRALSQMSVLSRGADQTVRFSLRDPDGNTLLFVGTAAVPPTHLN